MSLFVADGEGFRTKPRARVARTGVLKTPPQNAQGAPIGAPCAFGGGCGIRTHVGVNPNGFQDWIVPLPGVHGSSLCILNFTAKKDKKRVKMDGFWEKCEKIVQEGQKSEKNSSKKLREIFHELEGSNVSLLWQKTDKK